MLAELYANGCILGFHIFLLKRLFERSAVSSFSGFKLKLLYGAAYGVVGVVVLLFSVELDGKVHIDLRFIPIILSALYGGWSSSMMTAIVIGGARILLYGDSTLDLMGASSVLLMGFGCGCLSMVRCGVWVKWFLCTTFCFLVTFTMVSIYIGDARRICDFLFDYITICYVMSGLILRFQLYLRNMNQHYTRLERTNMLDSRTGAFSYRYFFEQFDRMLADKRGSREPFSLILVQCEELKRFNLEYGFGRVNRMLAVIAEQLKLTFPLQHMIARAVGAQFLVWTTRVDGQEHVAADQVGKLTLHVEGLAVPTTLCRIDVPSIGGTAEDLVLLLEERLLTVYKEEQRLRDEQLIRSERLRTVGEMAAGMAHEIRNPLTIVKGFLQLAKKRGDFTQVYDLIMHEVGRMSDLTKEFLHFAKPKSNQLKAVLLHSVIGKTLQLIDSEAISRGHLLEYVPDDPSLLAAIDEDKIVQVMLNLAKNAMEAMEDGGRLVIRLCRRGIDRVCVEVEDTGAGIPAELLNRIFDPFYSSKEAGTGLGLSICQKIMQDHQGSLEVSSIVGTGTIFRVILPLLGKSEKAG